MTRAPGLGVALLLACGLALAAEPAIRQDTRHWRYVEIPKGCYQLGSDQPGEVPAIGYPEPPYANETPLHEVCLSSFWLGETELTVGQWREVMGSEFAPGEDANLPAAGALSGKLGSLLARLNETPGAGGRYRLPTEAEWEYACRAGGEARIYERADQKGVNPLAVVAWTAASWPKEGLEGRRPVATKPPNAWGLYDMLGNVWELTADRYGAEAYRQHALFNPVSLAGTHPVIRGGGYASERIKVRCGVRSWIVAEEFNETVGVRLVFDPAGQK